MKNKAPNIKPRSRKSGKATAIKMLEDSIANDVKAVKVQHVLTNDTAKQLLDRGIDLIVKGNNAGLTDKLARAKADGHSKLLNACKGNIGTAIRAIMETPTADDLTRRDQRGARVFSLLSAVMKRCMFLANGRYQLWLNGKDQPLFALRDETRPPPYGLAFEEDAFIDAELKNAMEQLQAFFGGLVEAAGFDLEDRAFPFAYEEDPVRGWLPVTDLDHAYVIVEERARAAKVRRAEELAKSNTDAVMRALQLIEAGLERA